MYQKVRFGLLWAALAHFIPFGSVIVNRLGALDPLGTTWIRLGPLGSACDRFGTLVSPC
jgi:hypothetical protein